MRSPKYKKEILALFDKAHLLSLADIHKKISEADFSTIFRNVQRLCATRAVREVVVGRDSVMYERAGSSNERHDHFICDECGDVQAVRVPKKALSVGKAVIADVLIRGLCGSCA